MLLREQFRRLIDEAGLTQREVAHRLGREENYLSRKLLGRTRLLVDEACDIAQALGYRFEYAIVTTKEQRSAEARSAAAEVLDVFDHLTSREQSILRGCIRSFRADGHGRSVIQPSGHER